jgi:hypothetical protein
MYAMASGKASADHEGLPKIGARVSIAILLKYQRYSTTDNLYYRRPDSGGSDPIKRSAAPIPFYKDSRPGNQSEWYLKPLAALRGLLDQRRRQDSRAKRDIQQDEDHQRLRKAVSSSAAMLSGGVDGAVSGVPGDWP